MMPIARYATLAALAWLAACAEPTAPPWAPPAVAAIAPNRLTLVDNRTGELPPNARPGECYIRAAIPGVMQVQTERRLLRPATTLVSTVPAEFRTVEARVVTTPASRRIETIAAEYADRGETVVIRPASRAIERVEASWRTVTERVQTKPERRVWRISRELTPAQRVAAGVAADALDVYCLVVEPAEYAERTRQVQVTPAANRSVIIPAQTETVTRRVLIRPATTRSIVTPAEYGTVTREVQTRPARTERQRVAAEYETVQRDVVRSAAHSEWRQVLCEVNATPATLARIQTGLLSAGFDPGRADGVLDDGTLAALRRYQAARGLPQDDARAINMPTARALGV